MNERPQFTILTSEGTRRKGASIMSDERREQQIVKIKDYYVAARDNEGHIRLSNGHGMLVARKDDTREDIQGWFDMADAGLHWKKGYAAALHLLNVEEVNP